MFLGKHKPRIFAVADIGSGSGGVAILATNKHGPAEILAAERCALSFEERTLDATIAGINAKLSEAAEKAFAFAKANASIRHVDKVYAVIRGPWTHSTAVRVTSHLQEERKIDAGIINSLAAQVFNG